MKGFDIFASLPTSLACNILRDWLRLKSVVVLDSAYCCKANRTFFGELLQSDEYFVHEKFIYPQNSNNLYALPKFGDKIRCMYIKDNITNIQARLVAQYCRHLTHVYLNGPWCSSTLLCDALNLNQDIELLDIHIPEFERRSGKHKLSFSGISLPQVRTLALTGYGFEHKYIVAALQMSSSIVRLNLRGATLRESTLFEVQRLCPNLISLGLSNTRIDGRWSDDALSELTVACPHILHLDIDYALCNVQGAGITDAGILAVVQNLKGLQSLSILDNYDLTYASSVHIYTHCANTLKTLRINCFPHMIQNNLDGVSAFNTLFERCTQLRFLYFSDWYEGTTHDVGITLPASTLRNLTTLILEGGVVCDRNLTAIRNYGSNLHYLGLFSVTIDNVSPSLIMLALVELYIEIGAVDLSVYKRDGLTVGGAIPDHLMRFNVLDM